MALRVGILNIMPRLETYEPLLLEPLSRATEEVEPVLIRLETHAYESSDAHHLSRHYQTFEEALSERPLDGLVLTGAPVEHLDFDEVRYWPELRAILDYARADIQSTLGLCWGGLALAQRLGIEKSMLERKVFGVFENRVLDSDSPLLSDQADSFRGAHSQHSFRCAQSRHSGIADARLERAENCGVVRLLSHGAETGYSIFETPDHAFVAHLGHPEYIADRLVFEWARDRDLGRLDVPPPANFDPTAPSTSWLAHQRSFFDRWVRLVGEKRAQRPALSSPRGSVHRRLEHLEQLPDAL